MTGSVVSKNLIRYSNQRCIVVHRTNNLLLDGNVAYDTFGHCFMTEDGAEQGNVFRNNLGALTRRAIHLIPDNGKETDDDASTFWMTNPTNSWIGNVAAGSQSNGFWLELQYQVRGSNTEQYAHIVPKEEPLRLFSNNVAHSNRDVSRHYCGLVETVLLPSNIFAFLTLARFPLFTARNANVSEWLLSRGASHLS